MSANHLILVCCILSSIHAQYQPPNTQYSPPPNRDPTQFNYPQQNPNPNQPFNNYPQTSNYPQFSQQYPQNNHQYGNQNNGGQQYNNQDDCCQEYCYSQDEQPYLNYASKTAYQVVFGKQSNQHKIPDCNPIQFWSINRHGTRFPGVRTIRRLRELSKIRDEIIRNYEERRSYPDRGRLCQNDYDLLKRWKWNETITEQNANGLTDQGIIDMKYLARRYSSRFDTLLRLPYSEVTYNFQYTDSDRTHDSYQAYIEGLFRNNAYQVHANVFSSNKLIKPSDSCDSWQSEVKDNQETLTEYRRFKLKQDYQQMVRDVFRRLGFRYTLNDTIIDDMYDACRYEKAWKLDSHSAWCAVFNKEQLKLLEYAEDLKSYYTRGYGNEMNKKVGCPPLKDLYEKFEKTVNGVPDGNKVSVYFTHSVTIETFLAAMGIAKDYSPLTADNYYQQARRSWKTSTINPFASNLAATLYECRSGERYKAMFFLNEVPVNYPDCSVGLCNWSTVKEKLQSAAENCNLDFCNESGSGQLQFNFVTYLFGCALFYFMRF